MKSGKLFLLIVILLLLLFAACKKATSYTFEIDQTGCTACGKCFDACPHNAILFQDGKPVIIQSKCTNCGQCASICPENAIH